MNVPAKAGIWVILAAGHIVAAENNSLPPLAMWDATARVTAGPGYRDNVLRTSVAPESSAFIGTSFDTSVMRFSESGAYLMLLLLGDDVRYFDAPSVGYEQFFSGVAQGAFPVGASDELGGRFSYLYQHQVLDVSETEDVLTRMLVVGHTLALRPDWKHSFEGGWATRVEGVGSRQIYEGELSDYWEASGKMELIRSYGHRSEFLVSGRFGQLWYDSRLQYDEAGGSISNTALVYRQEEVGGEWRHNFDEARHWRLTSRIAFMRNQDNGSGYFDYDRLLFSEQLRWQTDRWEAKAGVRIGNYRYLVHEVGSEHLERSFVSFDARIERRLGGHWLLYALAERDWNTSNDPLDEYDDWMAGAGVGYAY
jgi:hypothetical protein